MEINRIVHMKPAYDVPVLRENGRYEEGEGSWRVKHKGICRVENVN
jgi:hypothetical protein